MTLFLLEVITLYVLPNIFQFDKKLNVWENILNLKSMFYEKVNYFPHKFQLMFHESKARFKTLAAGARGGKSMAAGAEAAPFLLIPDFRIWCVSVCYDLAEKEFVWVEHFLSEFKLSNGKKLIDLAKITNASRGSKEIRFPWGSFIKTKSCQKMTNLLGEELNGVILGEAAQIPLIAWKRYIRPRIGPRNGWALSPSTPNADGGLLRLFFNNGVSDEKDFEDWEVWQFSTLENPTFDKEEYETAKKELDDKVFQEQYEGKFVSRKGLVFPMFTDGNIIPELPGNFDGFPVLVGAHHEGNSFNNPLAVVFIAFNPETHDFIVYDEIYEKQAVYRDVFEKIRSKLRGKRLLGAIVDYNNPTLEEALKSIFSSVLKNNEKKYSKQHSTMRRIQVLHTLLKKREDGNSGLMFHKRCENVIEDFTNAKWHSPKKEESDMAEVSLPTTKNMAGPYAISYVAAWCLVNYHGKDVYEAQMSRRTS